MTRNVLASSAILVSLSLCALVHSLLVLHHLQRSDISCRQEPHDAVNYLESIHRNGLKVSLR